MAVIEGIAAVSGTESVFAAADSKRTAAGGFEDWLQQQVTATNDKIVDADQQLRKLAIGEAENLHQVMLALEEARMNFELVVQVRNRLLESYQEILRMRI